MRINKSTLYVKNPAGLKTLTPIDQLEIIPPHAFDFDEVVAIYDQRELYEDGQLVAVTPAGYTYVIELDLEQENIDWKNWLVVGTEFSFYGTHPEENMHTSAFGDIDRFESITNIDLVPRLPEGITLASADGWADYIITHNEVNHHLRILSLGGKNYLDIGRKSGIALQRPRFEASNKCTPIELFMPFELR